MKTTLICFIKVFLVSVFTIISARTFAAENNVLDDNFFPLKVGNRFLFDRYQTAWPPHGGGGTHSTYTIAVLRDTIVQNRKYYYINAGIYNNWFRVDSVTGSLYMYDPTNSCANYPYEKLRDSLKAELNQIINYCTVGSSNQCTSITNEILFGIPVVVKNFYVTNGTASHNRKYSDKFGPIHTNDTWSSGNFGTYSSLTLIGCKIDGKYYGDTDLVAITPVQNSIPASFHLFQNFPNPFNPNTMINFHIPQNVSVTLSVFNSVGKEMVRLIDKEQKQAGSYLIEFNGENYPSGFYFYRLESEKFTEVKKMVLVK